MEEIPSVNPMSEISYLNKADFEAEEIGSSPILQQQNRGSKRTTRNDMRLGEQNDPENCPPPVSPVCTLAPSTKRSRSSNEPEMLRSSPRVSFPSDLGFSHSQASSFSNRFSEHASSKHSSSIRSPNLAKSPVMKRELFSQKYLENLDPDAVLKVMRILAHELVRFKLEERAKHMEFNELR